MNKLLKVLALGTTVALLALSFGGCTAKPSTVTKGKLIMGTNAEFPPFEYKEGGEVVGVDASIMEAVAKKLDLELEIKDMAFESLPEELSGNKIDVIAAGFTVKPDREATMDFTDTYYTAMQTIIVKSDSGFKSKDDLTDKKIGVQTGTTGSFCAEDLTDAANIIGFNNGSLAVEALIAGNVDAVIIDNNPAKEYKTIHGDAVSLIEKQFDEEKYAIAVKKGNKTLLDAINKALKEMNDDGSFQKIIDQYIK